MRATIRRGSVGPDVASWQSVIGVKVDGVFGPATEASTKAWQAACGLVADGIVGPLSWAASPLVTPVELPEVLKGTDMASIQGVRPESEWRKLQEIGVRFAILRSVVGNETWNDTAARGNAERARAQGIEAWPYIFLYPLPHLSPEKEADAFVRRLEGMRMLGGPVSVDAEWPPREEWKKNADGTKTLTFPWRKWGCSAPQIRDWLARFLARFEGLTGRLAILYSYRYWLRSIEAHLLPELALRPLWLADYGLAGQWPTREQVARVRAEPPWDKIAIIQHDGDGGLRLPDSGIDADFNVLVGGEKELEALIGQRSASPSVPPPATQQGGFLSQDSVRLSTMGLMVEDTIAAYRRERITEDIDFAA